MSVVTVMMTNFGPVSASSVLSQKTDVQRHVQRPQNLQLKLAHQNFPFSLKLDSCRLIRGCEPSQREFESKPYVVISLFRELIEYILQFDILQSLFYEKGLIAS